jgi:hypothetical protein
MSDTLSKAPMRICDYMLKALKVPDTVPDTFSGPPNNFGILSVASIGPLTGPPSYRAAVSRAMLDVLKYPRLYFEQLSEVEAIFHGHWMAFHDLTGIDNHHSFNLSFGGWLWERKELSKSQGWAKAIIRFANANGLNAEKVFEDFVQEFFAAWATEEDADENRPSPL